MEVTVHRTVSEDRGELSITFDSKTGKIKNYSQEDWNGNVLPDHYMEDLISDIEDEFKIKLEI